MWTLAWKNLVKERIRLVISLGGVGLAVMLIIMLRGLFVSYEHRAGEYFHHVGGNSWVWQRNTASTFNSVSLVPDALRSEIQLEADSASGGEKLANAAHALGAVSP